jgi:hypothetical protein
LSIIYLLIQIRAKILIFRQCYKVFKEIPTFENFENFRKLLKTFENFENFSKAY